MTAVIALSPNDRSGFVEAISRGCPYVVLGLGRDLVEGNLADNRIFYTNEYRTLSFWEL